MKSILKSLGTAFFIAAFFLISVHFVDNWMITESRRALEEELTQASAHCYAVEGRYPPDLDYLKAHYGIRTEHRRFSVDYRRVAPDRAPQITVKLRKGGAWA